MTTAYIGQPISRVDGRAKVTGQAKYAAEYNVPGLTYGYVVSSEIAKGTITKIDASQALSLDGVLQVFTHENAPGTAWLDRNYRDDIAPPGSPFRPLVDNAIIFSQQPIALVVADTFELARYAASLVHIQYELAMHNTDLSGSRKQAYEPKRRSSVDPPPGPRGNAKAAFASAAIRHEAEYSAPAEHHNPMESFATTVVWEGDGKMTIYEKTQGAQNNQRYASKVFGLSVEDVRVMSPFVGGAFGSGLRPQYQLFLAVMAAQELKRSVRVSLTRQQMFSLGHRPIIVQHVALGAAGDGKLVALIHEAISETSTFEDYSEDVVNWSGMLYDCDNVTLEYKVAQLDTNTPIDMRAPGAAWGLWALESAMDELAYKLQVDPIQLRLTNYAERDRNEDKPFSSKQLRECYRQGAERFGWSTRNPAPRSMRDGAMLIGWGVATGSWEANQQKASARAVLTADGKLTVSSATADIGTGTYTIMTQIAADTLGLPIEHVTFQLGDSSLPASPVEGGSYTASTVGSAVTAVCAEVRDDVLALARQFKDSPLAGATLEDVMFSDGCVSLKSDPLRKVSITQALRHGQISSIEKETSSTPNLLKQSRYTRNSHSAIFAAVKVDEDLGTIELTRVVSAVAGGRILNPKTARSQVMGGVVWGIGMALEEESVIDQKFGRFMNHSLAEYHVPVNADVHEIDVIFVEEHDDIVNPIGVKGLGEIGVVGVAAAIANAVFHATGKRVRDLPITLDKLL